MGARVKTISDEMLIAGGVHDLDPEILITTAQAAMLLGCAVSGMAERKRSGRPPAPRQPDGRGTKVSYVLGEVLAARRSAPALGNVAARKIQQDHIRGFPTFTAFMAAGHLTDRWPFAIVDGRPVDFFHSLRIASFDHDRCAWLSLNQYLEQLRSAARASEATAENARMERGTAIAVGPQRSPERL